MVANISEILSLGVPGLLAFALLAAYMEWWVPGVRYRAKIAECQALTVENKQLWNEKVEDAKETAELAKAFLKVREQDR